MANVLAVPEMSEGVVMHAQAEKPTIPDYYHAVLIVEAPLVFELKEERAPAIFAHIGEQQLPLRVFSRLRNWLQEHYQENHSYHLVLSPRTIPQVGQLRQADLRLLSSDGSLPDGKQLTPGFKALGVLVNVNREEAMFILKILPNPKGHLQKPFFISLRGSLELIEKLPPRKSAVYVEGKLKPLSFTLMAESVYALAELPPTKSEEKPEDVKERQRQRTQEANARNKKNAKAPTKAAANQKAAPQREAASEIQDAVKRALDSDKGQQQQRPQRRRVRVNKK